MSSIKQISLCADDYGMHQSINAAILDLAEAGRLNAISCMTNQPAWHTSTRLTSLANVAIGLHFNIAYDKLGPFIINNYLHRLDMQSIQHALQAQLNAFQDVMGRQPDFIDGHQHIQQLPQVRAMLLEFYLTHFPDKRIMMRNTVNRVRTVKAMSLNILGGFTWRRLLQQHHIPTNCDFSGIYAFHQTDYATIFRKLLRGITQPTLFMCHPGKAELSHEPFRQREYAFLSSQAFQDTLQQCNVSLCPIADVVALLI